MSGIAVNRAALALAALLLLGGTASADEPAVVRRPGDIAALPVDTRAVAVESPSEPFPEERLADLARLPDLRVLDLSRAGARASPDGVGMARDDLRLTDAGLDALGAVDSLEDLALTDLARVTEEGLARLGRALPRLRRLTLKWHGAFGNGSALRLRCLSAFPALADLDLTGATGEHAAEWPARLREAASLRGLTLRHCIWARGAALPDLERLSLGPAADGDLAPLAACPALADLDLSESPHLTGAGLAPLAGLAGLRRLSLRNCGKVDALDALAGLTGLTDLDLAGGESLGDASLAVVGRLRGLTRLSLGVDHGGRSTRRNRGGAITDEGLAALAPLANLRELSLPGFYQVVWGCRTLAQGPVVTDLPGRITDAGLLRLARLPALERLDLRWNPGVTDEGVKRFVRARAGPPPLPGCEVRR